MKNSNKVLLMILDGWGIGKGDKTDVIAVPTQKT
jgi:bisphosphoglycerate-independent phosphoglycerate mutase (AlkP superfamily)